MIRNGEELSWSNLGPGHRPHSSSDLDQIGSITRNRPVTKMPFMSVSVAGLATDYPINGQPNLPSEKKLT